jgi:hypothetical protein
MACNNAAAQHSLPISDSNSADITQQENNDPFWQSTPRTNTSNHPNVAAFVAAMQHVSTTLHPISSRVSHVFLSLTFTSLQSLA